jgi:hypothetical protein
MRLLQFGGVQGAAPAKAATQFGAAEGKNQSHAPNAGANTVSSVPTQPIRPVAVEEVTHVIFHTEDSQERQ